MTAAASTKNTIGISIATVTAVTADTRSYRIVFFLYIATIAALATCSLGRDGTNCCDRTAAAVADSVGISIAAVTALAAC